MKEANNGHLQAFLSYYVNIDMPGYAVLVTGAWGTGKTYQVRRAIPEDSSHYISLYGVPSVDQLHTEVLAAVYPTVHKAGKAAELVKGFGGLGGLAVGATNLLGTYLRQELQPDKTLIFDDLERCRIPLEDLLGAINAYVEHRGFRTVVIAHDGKISDAFRAMREKTFGQVIEVEPQTRDAFSQFVGAVSSSKAQKFILKHQEKILNVFKQGGQASLRILRHVVMDLGRLHDVLSPTHLGHDAAMEHLVSHFVAFDVEVRSGEIGTDDLRQRRDAKFRYEVGRISNPDQATLPPLLHAEGKYVGLNLTSDTVLNDEVLEAIFIEGRYDQEAIRESLDNSAYFIKPSEAPPWKIVINFDELDDAVVNAAVKSMQQQFEKREVTDSGEILHIFALRLMMAAEGISGRNATEEVEACRAYIDDLAASERLAPREAAVRWTAAFDHGYQGLGFWVTEQMSPHFDELRNYLIEAREDALRRRFPELVRELIEKARVEPRAAFDMLSSTSNSSYASIPFMRDADAKSVVSAWLSAPRDQWRTLQNAFDSRYEQGQLQRELNEELNWARSLLQELERLAMQSPDLSGLRIKRIIPKALKELRADSDNLDQ